MTVGIAAQLSPTSLSDFWVSCLLLRFQNSYLMTVFLWAWFLVKENLGLSSKEHTRIQMVQW